MTNSASTSLSLATIAQVLQAARRQRTRAFPLLALMVLAGAASPVVATKCRSSGLQAHYDAAEMVYEATLVLAEYMEEARHSDPGLQVPAEPGYRFLLRVNRVYKGNPGAVVEKHKLAFGLEIVTPAPSVRLEAHRLLTRFLIFEPQWDSACSQSTRIDEDVESRILPQIRTLSAESQ